MKYILLLLSLSLITIRTNGQNPTSFQNTEKYWWYRYKLVNDFMKIGDKPGESIPASERYRNHAYYYENGYYFWGNRYAPSLHWGDATQHLGNYIMALAAEYKMLSTNALSTERTRKELYYALAAFDRLDLNAEKYCRHPDDTYPCAPANSYAPQPGDLNGFFVRDDIPLYHNPATGCYDFVEANYNHFNRAAASVQNVESASSGAWEGRFKVNGTYQPYHTTWTKNDHAMPSEESHDQMVELYMGMALVTRLVDDGATYQGVNLRKQAGKAETRLVMHARDYNNGDQLRWKIKNPTTGNCVYGVSPDKGCNKGGAEVLFMGVGASKALGQSAEGTGAVTNSQINSWVSMSGNAYKAAWMLAQYGNIAFTSINTPIADLVYPCTYAAFSDDWRAPGTCYKDVWTPLGTAHVPYPCIKNTTFKYIKNMCLSNSQYPHVPMVYKIISGPGTGHGMEDIDFPQVTLNSGRAGSDRWAELFEKAPACGCYNFADKKGNQTDYGNWFWSSPNWSQDYFKRGQYGNAELNNIDYMYLYNLYNLNESKYINYYFNSFYKENFSVAYPYRGIGATNAKLSFNFLEYLSLKNKHANTANLTYRGAKVVELLPGFEAQRGSTVSVYVKDFECQNSKKDSYYYADINGVKFVNPTLLDRSLGHRGTEEAEDNDTVGALDLVPYQVEEGFNPNYDPSAVDTSTTPPTEEELQAVQQYKDSLLNIVYEEGDEDLIRQLTDMGIISGQQQSRGQATEIQQKSRGQAMIIIKEILLYPNPTTGQFTLAVPDDQTYEVSIMNMLGMEISQRMLTGQNKYSITLPDNLPSGIYLVSVISSAKAKTVKRITLVK